MKQESLNIYCDESRVENLDSERMVIGALIIPRTEKKRMALSVSEIMKKHSFVWEIKWTKTSNRFEAFYKELLDYFISEEAIQYRCIIVDKKSVGYSEHHNDDKELAFFKFYYLMLKQKLLDFKKYYIFIDKKPTRDKNRARALHAYLDSYTLVYKHQCSIEHLQAYHSKDNIFLQLADYLTGLVACSVNEPNKKAFKYLIADYFREKLGRKSFLNTSTLSEVKFNTFVWKGRNEKNR